MSGDNSLLNIGQLAEPITKMVEAVSAGIGVLYEPTRIRRKAEAKAQALVTMAVARRRAETIEERAQIRVVTLENQRQQNIESIVDKAIEELSEKASPDPIHPDWMRFFLVSSQDTSDEQIQHLWARVLAGETESPGKYSRRLLEFIRLISKSEALAVSDYCRFIWTIVSSNEVICVYLNSELIQWNAPSKPGGPFVTYGRRLEMQRLGVASVETGLHTTLDTKAGPYFFVIGKRAYILDHPEYSAGGLEADFLTPLGQELFLLCNDIEPSKDYEVACVHQYHFGDPSDEDAQRLESILHKKGENS